MAKSFDELAKRTMSAASIARANRKAQAMVVAYALAELRAAVGVSQSGLAKRLGIRQPSLSKLEHQRDMRIGTLRRMVEALGGELEVVARWRDRSVRLDAFGQPSKNAATPTRKRSSPSRRNATAA